MLFNAVARNDEYKVVTWKPDGTALSFIADDSWEVWPLSRHVKDPMAISVAFLPQDEEEPEFAKYYEARQFMAELLKRSRSVNGPNMSLICTVLSAVKLIVQSPVSVGLSFFEFFSDSKVFSNFVSSLNDVYSVKKVGQLLLKLGSCKEVFGQIKIAAGLKLILKKRAAKLVSFSRQHPVIPVSILHHILNNYNQVIEEYLQLRDSICEFITNAVKIPGYAKGKKYQKGLGFSKEQMHEYGFRQQVDRFGLGDICKKFDIDSLRNFTKYLSCVQFCGKILAEFYSGMRRTEAYSMKVGCLKRSIKGYGKIFSLVSVTTKLELEPKESSWITSPEMERVIDALEHISNMIYSSSLELANSEGRMLFVSCAYLPFSPFYFSARDPDERVTLSSLEPSFMRHKMPQPIITSRDVAELEISDPFYNWKGDTDYSVGQSWPLTNHQLRRSLCVYAARSGIVGIAELKIQLKHISELMTTYYGKSFSRVRDLLKPHEDHIFYQMVSERPVADAIAYVKDILLSNEPLLGAAGKRLSSLSHRDGIVFLDSLKETHDKCKKGLMAYRPTSLGGCVLVGECTKAAYPTIASCMGCSEGVAKISNIKFALEREQSFLAKLSKGTVEYSAQLIEVADLNRILIRMQ